MRVGAEKLLAPAMALSLMIGGNVACSTVDGTECEEMGIAISPHLDGGGYVLKLALQDVGDNSITGDIVEIVEAKDNGVCDRFQNRTKGKPLKLHDNYNTGDFFDSRKFVCSVFERGEQRPFQSARSGLKQLADSSQEVVLTVRGRNRKSYTGSDTNGNASHEKRDVCQEIRIPLR